ncbi:DUF5806 family protein [Halegenticoccus soli]|uniref:DUF5806 family protein n=1 Tax=Halegenticoccus soli TaxID=1985678 RepID=UPI000C6CC6BC|nr:DUF5806 family protein [Halegenticoccus soli]
MADDPATTPDSAREEAADATDRKAVSEDEAASDAAEVSEDEAVGNTAEVSEDETAHRVEGGDDVESDAADGAEEASPGDSPRQSVPDDVRKYERFKKMDGAQYDRVNGFLRDRTYITAREWAIARLCADFRTETGVEMTKIGENLPRLVPFMTDTYTPQAVNQARSSFEGKVKKAGATFLYGAMCGFFTAEELDEMMYEVTEIAKFLLEVEGVDLSVDEELAAEERISSVMREVRQSSAALRSEEVECPNCGHTHEV